MSIKHAPWATPPPLVSCVNWDQEAWNRYSEKYRPHGYTGEIHDQTAYLRWTAEQAVDASGEGVLFDTNTGMAVCPIATPEDIKRYIRVAGYCGCDKCFCCAVRAVVEERKAAQ